MAADEKRLKVTAEIFVAAEPDKDPEDVATSMERGLSAALQGFPDGEVTGARVEAITPASEEEVGAYFEE